MRRILNSLIILLFLGLLLSCSYARYVATDNDSAPSAQQLERFLHAYALVEDNYVKPVTDKELINNAIRGMLEGLDSHSTYLDKTDSQFIEQLTTGEFTGIGVEVVPDDGALKVVTALDNSPAQKAGILPDDEIVEVNQAPLADMSFRDAIQALRGPIGSSVELTIARTKVNTPIELTLIRANMPVQSVRSRLLSPHIGYIRISVFDKNTPAEVRKAVDSLTDNNKTPLQGVVIDLRNNPGGLLETAAAVADLFLDAQTIANNRLIVYTRGRTGQTVYVANADEKDILNNIPMVILINQGSASGAEVVAGALHDHHRATLVGMKSYGKGSVQTVIPLDDDGSIKLTTALYYTPNGELIDHIGITPDFVVPMVPLAKQDVQLQKAQQVLQQQLS